MEIKKFVKLDIYGCRIAVVITDTMDTTLKKYFKKFKLSLDDGFYYGLFLSPPPELSQDSYYIFLNNKGLSLNTIVHEVYHACNKILKDREFEMEDEEPMAYLIGYVLEAVVGIVTAQRINLTNGAK